MAAVGLPLQWDGLRVELVVDALPSPPTPLQCGCHALQLLMMAHAPQRGVLYVLKQLLVLFHTSFVQ